MFENEIGKLKKSNNKIWKELEETLKGKITAPTIYLNFQKNRGNLLNILLEKTILSQAESMKNKNVSDSESLSDEYNNMDDFEEDSKKLNFKINLNFDDFRNLKPETRSYDVTIIQKHIQV